MACFSPAAPHFGKASGIVDGYIAFLMARAATGSQMPIASEAVPDALKACKLFGVDMERRQHCWQKGTETQGLEHPDQSGDGVR